MLLTEAARIVADEAELLPPAPVLPPCASGMPPEQARPTTLR